MLFQKSPYASGKLASPPMPLNFIMSLAALAISMVVIFISTYSTAINFAPSFFYPTRAINSMTNLYDTITTTPTFQPLLLYVVPALLSLVSYLLYLAYQAMVAQFHSAFCRTLTIKNTDENYATILSFLSSKCDVKSSSHIAETYKNKNKSWKDRMTEWRTGSSATATKFVYVPSTDKATLSFLTYKNRNIVMSRASGETVTVGIDRRPQIMETLTLTVWGTDSQILYDLFDDALSNAKTETSDELNVWVLGDSWLGGWEKALTKKLRTSDSVILDGNLSSTILEDAQRFQNSSDWYMSRGIPYRRGYLFHGPPGTGKTSFVQVLAGQLQKDMCMLNLSDKELNDTTLAAALRDTPKNSLIMIEDIDSIFVERKKQDNHSGGVTFSGLLNALDGVASQEGRITIMTTNHIDRLDPALIRPGRIDLKVEVKNASKSQAKLMFLRFYENETKLSEDFAAKIPEHEIAMASLQGHFLSNRDDPQKAVDTVHDLLASKQVIGDGLMPVYEHLRRVGLERYAYAFESFGFYTKEDFDALNIETIKSYIVDLLWDKKSLSRFEKLLEKDEVLMAGYVLCDVPSIKEMFRSQFPQSKCDRVCEVLAPDGTGLVSVWQLKWYLQCYGEKEEEAVDNLSVLTCPREDSKASWMTAYDFCKREGSAAFALCAYELESKGYKYVRDFVDLTDLAELKDAGFEGNDNGNIALAALDTNDKKKQYVKMRFTLVDFVHAKREFSKRFGDLYSTKFARAITDKSGFGLISMGEITAFLSKHIGDPARACELASSLTTYEREPQPVAAAKEEVVGWIVDFLGTGGKHLEQYADAFIEQEVTSPIDVSGISDSQLERIFGITKFGHRKQVFRLISTLEKELERENGEEKKSLE